MYIHSETLALCSLSTTACSSAPTRAAEHGPQAAVAVVQLYLCTRRATMASPRLMALSQPKKVEDPSTNPYRLQNVALNSPKPLWRSTRPLEGANGLPAVYKRSETKDYHEARFGWRSGFWTMWDTEPNGTKNAIRVAPDEIQQNVAFHQIRDRPHDDPCRMQRAFAQRVSFCGRDTLSMLRTLALRGCTSRAADHAPQRCVLCDVCAAVLTSHMLPFSQCSRQRIHRARG
jgi:hypothetical protein